MRTLESGPLDRVELAAAVLLPPGDLVVVFAEAPVGALGDGEQSGGSHGEIPVQSRPWMGQQRRYWGQDPGLGQTGVRHRDAREVSLEVEPEGLQELRVGLLEVEEPLLGSAVVVVAAAAETAGSTAGWEGGLTSASALPGKSGPDCSPWSRLAAALCDWETRSVDI